jgi:hypothetical protein
MGASNALFWRSKRRKGRVKRASDATDCQSESDSEQAVHVAGGSIEDRDEQEAECLYFIGRFSEDYNGEYRILCVKCF